MLSKRSCTSCIIRFNSAVKVWEQGINPRRMLTCWLQPPWGPNPFLFPPSLGDTEPMSGVASTPRLVVRRPEAASTMCSGLPFLLLRYGCIWQWPSYPSKTWISTDNLLLHICFPLVFILSFSSPRTLGRQHGTTSHWSPAVTVMHKNCPFPCLIFLVIASIL